MNRSSDFLLFEALSPLFVRDGQILRLSPFRGIGSIFFPRWSETRTFSYSRPRLHNYSGMDRYSDFLLFEASSPLLFKNGQILLLSPFRGLVFIIIQEQTDTRISPIRGLVSIIIQEWTDSRTFFFFESSSLFLFRNRQILRLIPIRGLVCIFIQEWTDTQIFSFSRPRLHIYSGMD